MNSRGNQADDRKYREPSYTPGAWNVERCHQSYRHTFSPNGYHSEKVDQAEGGWEVAAGANVIETLGLRRIAGFAVNVIQVYSDARSYLKGIFNAIEAFRWGRDMDGWRLQYSMDQAELEAVLAEDDEDILRPSSPAH